MRKIFLQLLLIALLGTALFGNSTWQQPQSLAAGLGVGQNWTDVTTSRNTAGVYQNNTGKPILVAAGFTHNTGALIGLIINGVIVYGGSVVPGGYGAFSIVVPNGATYQTYCSQGTLTKIDWKELR